MKPKPTLGKGFTLIEILVVIAIILLLVAIVFPVFAGVREQANSRRCISNLSQLGKAFLLYLQDWDERFPKAGIIFPREEYLSSASWVGRDPETLIVLPEYGAIYPYVRNTEVYLCPSDPSAQETRLSYMMNPDLADHTGFVIRYYSEIREPANVVLLAEFEKEPGIDSAFPFCPEGVFPAEAGYVCPDMTPYCADEVDFCMPWLACRHAGRITNVLFCDGHVKGFPPGALLCKHIRVE